MTTKGASTNAQDRVEYPARQIKLSTHAQNRKQMDGTIMLVMAADAVKRMPADMALIIDTATNIADMARYISAGVQKFLMAATVSIFWLVRGGVYMYTIDILESHPSTPQLHPV